MTSFLRAPPLTECQLPLDGSNNSEGLKAYLIIYFMHLIKTFFQCRLFKSINNIPKRNSRIHFAILPVILWDWESVDNGIYMADSDEVQTYLWPAQCPHCVIVQA
jgi:hypothetical protein